MFTRIFSWSYEGRPVFTVFRSLYVKRKYGRRFVLRPYGSQTMEDLTPEEIGQLLGGN